MSSDPAESDKLLLTMDDVKSLKDMESKLSEEDKKFGPLVEQKISEFEKEHTVGREDFTKEYNEAIKNFRLDFGIVCERGQAELVENLNKGKDKRRVSAEYLSCVELSRQKAAQRAQQD